MNSAFQWVTNLGDKTGSVGALVAAMGCSACFPAIATLGGALGLGFLSQWEWFFINTMLPIFAWITLVIHALNWFKHHHWKRSVIGMLGPFVLLLSLYPMFPYAWSIYFTYSALALMIAVSIGEIVSPTNKIGGLKEAKSS